MKHFISILLLGLLLFSCGTNKNVTENSDDLPENAVRIANDSLEYEIIIIEPGFDIYLATIAKPANFYSQSYYENKNRFYVTEWNQRHRQPFQYNPSIYENEIDYDYTVDYGLDVNYKLYNYFKFIEYKYNQRFF